HTCLDHRHQRTLYSLFLQCAAPHRDLHSFPTRRSSDLPKLNVTTSDTRASSGMPIPSSCRGSANASLSTDRHCSSTCARRSRISDRKSTRLNSSHQIISYAVFCLKKKKKKKRKESDNKH